MPLSQTETAKQQREDYKWYQSIGICPKCRKVKLYGDEKACPECTARTYASVMKSREKDPEHYNEYRNEYQRELWRNRSEKGVCARCGRPKENDKYKTCLMCRSKARKNQQKNHKRPSAEDKHAEGRCYYCNNPVAPGLKVCEKCRQRCIENQSHVDRKNHIWSKSYKGGEK